MKKILALALVLASSGCVATMRKPTVEVWCYDPVWRTGEKGDKIGTQLAVCQSLDGEAIQVVIVNQPTVKSH